MAVDVRNRLQPALLDRLTDDEPDAASGGRVAPRHVEGAAAPGGAARPRRAVQLRCSRSARAAEPYPLLAESVLNFGLPPLSGQLASKLDVGLPRERDPPGDPALRAAHPGRHAAGHARWRRRASSTRTTSSSSRSAATSGRSRCRSRSCCAPSSISRPARSRCATSAASRRRRRASERGRADHGPAPAAPLQRRARRTCARSAPSSRASSRRSRRASASRAWRSPTPTSSACSKASPS